MDTTDADMRRTVDDAMDADRNRADMTFADPVIETLADLLESQSWERGADLLFIGQCDHDRLARLLSTGCRVQAYDPAPIRARRATQDHRRRGAGPELAIIGTASLDDLNLQPTHYDLIVLDGSHHDARWHRWLLRRVFYALQPGGLFAAAVGPEAIPGCGASGRQRAATRPARTGGSTGRPMGTVGGPHALAGLAQPTVNGFMTRCIEIGFEPIASRSLMPGMTPDGRPKRNDADAEAADHRTDSHDEHRGAQDLRDSASGLTRAIRWGVRAIQRTGLIQSKQDSAAMLFRKPQTAGAAACLDVTPTIQHELDQFRTYYASEFERLARWRRESAGDFDRLPTASVTRRVESARSVVVLSPHPDDELIGCGATLLSLVERGAAVHIVQLTDGSASQALAGEPECIRRTARLGEAQRVADRMGAASFRFLGAANNRLNCSPEFVERLTGIVTDAQPDVIFVPFVNDRHRDHVAANHLLAAVLDSASMRRAPLVLSYEVWSLVPEHWVVATDSFMQAKLDLLMLYGVPMRVVDYVRHCQIRDAYHSRASLGRSGYAEAFLATTVRQHAMLVHAHRPAVRPPAALSVGPNP